MKKLFILCIGLALLLCACGTPAGPSTNLSDFVTAFDLSDLSRYLSEEQLDALNGALSENLSMACGIDNYALYYDDPPEGSVKLPFDNAGGLSLANLDIEKLAERIAGQIAAELEGKGEPVIAATGAGSTATTTTKPSTTTNTTATTTATPKPASPNTLKLSDLGSSTVSTLTKDKNLFQDDFAAESPKIARFHNDEGDWIFLREKIEKNRYKQDGLILHIYLDRSGNGTYEFIQTIQNNGEPDVDGMFVTTLSLDKGRLRLVDNNDGWPPRYQSSDTVSFLLRNPNDRNHLATLDISLSTGGASESWLSSSGRVFWKFDGTVFVKA